jgi:AcrR family transcriptional regulator
MAGLPPGATAAVPQPRARRLPSDKRKRQIIESARGVFAEQPYGRVGTADLARAAGISEPALYRHFAGKKELFVATIRATGPRLLEIWEDISVDYEDPIETLWAIGVYYYDHLESHAANMRLQFRALSEADDGEIRAALHDNFDAFVTFIADTLDEGKARGIGRRDVDPRMVAWQFLGIGMTLDLMHMLGFNDEMDRARADMWGRIYLETVRRKDGARLTYINAEATPARAI